MRVLPLILVALMACGGASSPGKVDQAVTVAKELKAKPDDAEKILASHNLTPEQWEALMYEIAEDPALAEKYEAALNP